eukprot:s1903_g20.t2
MVAAGGEPLSTLALPLLRRQGGMLLAFPCGVIDPDAFAKSPADEDQMLGPARTFEGLALYEEDEVEAGGLQVVPTGAACPVIVCDVLDSILIYLRDFDPVTDSHVDLVPFDEARPAAVPLHAEIAPLALEWARSEVEGRVLFYSAREEQENPPRISAPLGKKAQSKRVTTATLAEQVSALSAQMTLLMKQQAVANGPGPGTPGQPYQAASNISTACRMPPVRQMLAPPPRATGTAKLALLGPPPKIRATPAQAPLPPEEPYDVLEGGVDHDPTASVLSQQSAALTALVAHLVNQEGGLDLSGAPGSSMSSTKGTMRREKMQQELAGRKSTFFMQVQQQIYKKMRPSKLLPKTEEEMQQAQVSILSYLERYGGYKGQREAGLSMWIFGHAMDAAAAGDFSATKEFLASLRLDLGGGPPIDTFYREDEYHDSCRETFLPVGATGLGINQLGIHQRTRGALNEACRDTRQEGRRIQSEPGWEEAGCGGGSTQPQAPASVSEEAEGHSRRIAEPSPCMGPSYQVHNEEPEEQGVFPEFIQHSKGPSFWGPGFSEDGLDAAGSFSPSPSGNVQGVRGPPPYSKGCHHLSFHTWCAKLTSFVLRTRCAFSAFLHFSIRVSKFTSPRGGLALAFFPIPVPASGVFDRMPANPSRKKRQSLFLSRAVHVIVMAMNFWHSAGVFSSEKDLWRRPNNLHRRFYKFIRSLARADGLNAEFDTVHSGRKNPDLHARLFDLVSVFQTTGGSANPYDRAFHGFHVPRDESRYPELQPYRDLDPGRLKLSGRGAWDASPFLSENLLMAYKEPLVLKLDRIPAVWEYPRLRDDQTTILELARVWDSQSLLLLHQEEVDTRADFELVRIFNAYKNEENDRQIGDRRGRNAIEAVVKGPSNNLPAGSDLCDLVVDPTHQVLAIAISDRKDYYHQIKVTRRKAICNTLGPGLPMHALEGLEAYGNFLLWSSSKKRYNRLRDGDRLGCHRAKSARPSEDLVWASFNSILQGDHCGVDIATEAHTQLLQSYGLLGPSLQLTANRPCRHDTVVQGLVIDDFFCVSVEEKGTPPEQTAAVQAYSQAQKAYQTAGLLGSPEKDKCGEREGKAIGAYLNASERATDRGLCTVGAPVEKRLSLAALSLQVCQLPCTTFGLHSCIMGAWVSMMMYRRPMMSIFDHAFRLIDSADVAARNHEVLPLPRAVAQELTLAAVLSPLMVTNLAARYDSHIYATDASEEAGAVCQTPASADLQQVLFRSCRTKGAYTRLLSPMQVLLKKLNEFEEVGEEPASLSLPKPGRPLAFVFEFLEVFSGASRVTEFVASFGIPCGPPIDLSRSEEFDLRRPHLVDWITHLISEKILKAVLLMPPCTTFSIVRRPALRNADFPFGFDTTDEQTLVGNTLAQRSFQIAWVADTNEAIAVIEKPHSSKMKHLPSWKVLASLQSANLTRSDSCQFGSIHQKSFSFLSINLDLAPIARRCQGLCNHIPVQGIYTKASATYVAKLAYGLAHCFADGIFQMRAREASFEEPVSSGLENQLVNEVMLSSSWELQKAWAFRKASHINLLELKSVEGLVDTQVKKAQSLRFISLVDSNVSRGALGKGRSASKAVMAVLRRINSKLIASDLYMVNPFCPTRLNVADDPTRDRPIRGAVPGLSLMRLSKNDLYDLAALPPTRKWASNWLRIILLLCSPAIIHLRDRSLFRRASSHRPRPCLQSCSPLDFSKMDFDSSLGFPGEGPVMDFLCRLGLGLGFRRRPSSLGILSLMAFALANPAIPQPSFLKASAPCLPLLAAGCGVLPLPLALLWGASSSSFIRSADAMVLGPNTGAERRKAAERAQRPILPIGRPTLEVTTRLRQRYWRMFLDWTVSEGIDFQALLLSYHLYVEDINIILARYGRVLYSAGKPYSVFAETINMLTSIKPVLRRQLQGAWDLAFSWVQAEPSVHHIAMPWQVLLAMVTVALAWQWTRVAGCLALGWGALLRAGEIIGALRHDLLLPRDVDFTVAYALLSLQEPKTRNTGPRHQAAKLDVPDLLEVVDLAFGAMPEHFKLWGQSGQTLRLRFKDILRELQLPTEKLPGLKPLDLGSLRSGGATWHLQTTEDGEYCRRKGRWLSQKVMEIYVQETTALLYLKRIPEPGKIKTLAVANLFPTVLARAKALRRATVPDNVWFCLLQKPATERRPVEVVGSMGDQAALQHAAAACASKKAMEKETRALEWNWVPQPSHSRSVLEAVQRDVALHSDHQALLAVPCSMNCSSIKSDTLAFSRDAPRPARWL